MSDLFWFSDAQWERIAPLLPTGLRCARRVDDRRVLSGIFHALKSGGRWSDCPEHQAARHLRRKWQALCSTADARKCARHARCQAMYCGHAAIRGTDG